MIVGDDEIDNGNIGLVIGASITGAALVTVAAYGIYKYAIMQSAPQAVGVVPPVTTTGI